MKEGAMAISTTAQEARVPLAEIGAFLGLPDVQPLIERAKTMKVEPVTGWDGSPTVPESVAARISSDVLREREEQRQSDILFAAYLRRRERERGEAADSAYRQVHDARLQLEGRAVLELGRDTAWVGFGTGVWPTTPGARAAAAAARDEAAARFDREHPRLTRAVGQARRRAMRETATIERGTHEALRQFEKAKRLFPHALKFWFDHGRLVAVGPPEARMAGRDWRRAADERERRLRLIELEG
jgi:hypothetical protein